jgi:lysophospholipase L1-like esterase
MDILACIVLLSYTTGGEPAFAGPKDAFLIRDGDRVVFYGDSITDSEWYPTLVETYVLTRHPSWRNHFANRGVSGDNSGSIARFERDVVAQRPDLFTYNMGFNDGGFWGLRPAQLQSWLTNIAHSVALARRANPRVRGVLLSPIPNEPSVSTDPRWVSREVYPYVMLSYGHEEEKLSARLGLPFVDLGLLYGQSMGLGKVAGGATFQLSRDGVHPQREGQTLLAFHVLRGLGAGAGVAEVAIDAARGRVTRAAGCKVSGLTVGDGVVQFERTCDALPYPTPPEARPFAFLARIDDHLSLDALTITGLGTNAWTLYVDDRRLGDVAAAELKEGINLTRFVATPMYEQAVAVMEAVRRKQEAETEFWRRFIVSGKADGAGRDTAEATPDERAAMAAARQAVAAAETAAYALNTPRRHTIRLERSAARVAPFDSLAAAEIHQAPLDIRLSPVEADWNAQALLTNALTVTVANAAGVPRNGNMSWSCPAGWRVEPAQAAFSVGATQSVALAFAVSAAAGGGLMPSPEWTAVWRWSKDWPYPMRVTRPVEILPHLGIARTASAPGLTGNADDWRSATSFTLDQVAYVDPAVPGKKALWGGPDDLSARFFLTWDDRALYVAALVRDNEHVQNASEMMTWAQDCLMLGFYMPGSGKPDARYEFIFAALPGEDRIQQTAGPPPAAAAPGVRFRSRMDAQGGTCLYEVAVPWSALVPFVPAAGSRFRFACSVSDADPQPGKGFNYLSWTHGVNYGKNPADFATITLR